MKRVIMDTNLEIKLINRDSLAEQVKAFRAAFHSPLSEQAVYDMWEKKHYANPLGDSLAFGAYADGLLVGMNSFMPVDYLYKGETLHLLQSCESGVIPEYQGKGIWSKLMKFAMNYIRNNTSYKAVIGFPNYRNSYPGFKKMGWMTLTNMNNYLMVNNPTAFSKILSSNKLIQYIGKISVVQRIGVGIVGRQYKRYEFEEVCDNEIVWNDCENVLSIAHTEELIDWKKHYKGLKTYNLKKNGEELASCLFSIGEFRGAPVLILEKIEVSAKSTLSLKKAIALTLRCIARQFPEIAIVRVWTTQESIMERNLKKLLFIKFSHPNPFIINHQPSEIEGVDWSLSFFDLD